ncbi:hypothetical protein NIES4071_06770 [Calothrix sp. NIES-4071]|nr:hypothetical protein NIES4071_06770 [Calothrix sp. NIES-4071]BAZ55019.1 hypothetical protein NIES4105_06730 [Calothrix sp. NIES-4105]
MTITLAIIPTLNQLITVGEVLIADISFLNAGKNLGLWAPSADGKRAVATSATVQLLQSLPNKAETIGALISCEPDIRQAWGKIIAARLQELGTSRNAEKLCDAINTLGEASAPLLKLLPQASLSNTNYTEIERRVFDSPAEQALAAPKLLRVLGATADLVEGKGAPVNSLPDIDALNPGVNWVRGRLLQLPLKNAEVLTKGTSILFGGWGELSSQERVLEDTPSQAIMRWVLYRPWVFLLAQVVFTQEAWMAERVSGKLSLELENSYLSQFEKPPQILVVITTPTGEEVICGTLAELILRVLNHLGVFILTEHSPTEPLYLTTLQERLAPIISALLQNKVWRFESGNSSQRLSYTIHPDFSNSCYRVLGSKSFNRLGNSVTSAIRGVCDGWVQEKLAVAGNAALVRGIL